MTRTSRFLALIAPLLLVLGMSAAQAATYQFRLPMKGVVVTTEPPAPSFNLSLSEAMFDYGESPLGTSDSSKIVWIRNDGDSDVPLPTPYFQTRTDFAVYPNSSCPAVLAPNTKCQLTVYYRSLGVGARTDTLVFPVVGSPRSIAFSGTAYGLDIGVSTTQLDFGLVAVDGSSTRSVTYTNNGSRPVSIRPFLTGNPGSPYAGFVTVDEACNVTLGQGQSCTTAVTFAPYGGVDLMAEGVTLQVQVGSLLKQVLIYGSAN